MMMHKILESLNPIYVFNLRLVPAEMNKNYLKNANTKSFANLVLVQKKYNIIFCFDANTQLELQSKFLDEVSNKRNNLFYSIFKTALNILAPLASKENLLVTINIHKNKYESYQIDFNIKTKYVYDSFFGFCISFRFSQHPKLNKIHKKYYTISQFNAIIRQQIFNSKIGDVSYDCASLGFSVSHGQDFVTDHKHYIIQGREIKFNTPKSCSSCKHFCYDSLDTCAINQTNIEEKIIPGFYCNDYQLDNLRYKPIKHF